MSAPTGSEWMVEADVPRTSGPIVQPFDVHVIPLTAPLHVRDRHCWCDPRIEHDPSGNDLVMHRNHQ